MATPISQRITLEGAAEIRRELQAIAAAASATVDKMKGFEAASGPMSKVGDAAASLGERIQLARQKFSEAGQQFDLLGGKAITLGRNLGLIGIAVVGSVAAFGGWISKLGDAQEALQNTADAVGLTVEKFDEMRKAAELSGVSNNQFEKGLLSFQKALNAANKPAEDFEKGLTKLRREYARGGLSATDFQKKMRDLNDAFNDAETPFRKLGVATRNLDGSTVDIKTAFQETGRALKEMGEGAEATGLKMEVFGSRNIKMASFAALSAEEVRKLEARIRRLAPTLSEDLRGALDSAGDSFSFIGKAAMATGEQVTAAFAPLAGRVFDEVSEAIARVRGPMVAWANELANKLAPQVGSFIALLQGRDKDVFPWMLAARDKVVAFGKAIEQTFKLIIVPAFNAVLAVADTLASGINSIFGTEFTGGALLAVGILLKFLGVFSLLSTAVTAVSLVIQGLLILFTGPAGLAVAVGAIVIAVGLLASKWLESVGGMQGLWTTFTAFLASAWETAKNVILGGITAVYDRFKGFYDAAIGWFSNLIQKAREYAAAAAAAASASGGSGEGGAQAYARGGHVRGPGSGTSDSILARLSNGEFVITAKRVRELGLGFLQRLNGASGSFSEMLRGAAGHMPTPGFATGGLVTAGTGSSGMRPFVLQLSDGSQFGGMSATADTIDRLMKYSAAANVRSAGRKPSWIGRGR